MCYRVFEKDNLCCQTVTAGRLFSGLLTQVLSGTVHTDRSCQLHKHRQTADRFHEVETGRQVP